ncbi:MAG: EAL domain-containing protein [Nitrospirae bacterium]|nr:EAL domain-containing protein [Nitrospirota bacterium]
MPPLSGIVQLYGQEISNAGLIACSEVNEEGGVLGRELELIIVDDGSLPETAVPAAERLVRDFGCSAIIGNLLSNSRISVSNFVSEPLKIPYLNFSFYEGSIFGKYFFHFAALPNQQIDLMIPYMQKNFGPKMFFAGNNYEWPRGSIEAAKKTLLDNYGEIVGEEYLPIGTPIKDITSLIEKIAASGADVLVPYFAGTDQINLLNAFAEKGLKKRMAVVMGHYDEAMVSLLAPEVRESLYSSNTYFMSINTNKNREYLDRLSRLEGINGIWPSGNGVMTNFGEGTYLCVKAFAKAANLSGSLDSNKIADALETIEVESPQGIVKMNPSTHHAAVNTYLARCEADGVFSIIESFGQIQPVIPERYREASKILTPVTSDTATRFLEKRAISAMNACGVTSQILQTLDVVIITTDINGIILEANSEAYRQFGYAPDELSGKSVHFLVPPNLRMRHTQLFKEFVEGDAMEISLGKRGEIQGYRKDGTFFPAEASVSRFFHEDQWILVAALRDISERKKTEETLVWRATHDPLTKLPNRTLIKERLTSALTRTTYNKKNVGLIFIDLDSFKLVNDTYGHDAGDKLLISVTEILTNAVRPGDTVARISGDEFVVLCEQIDSEEKLIVIAERINESMRIPIIVNEHKVYISASIGMAIGHGTTHSAEALLRDADAAMYMIKEHGRDGWHLFSEKTRDNLNRKLTVINGLRTAIELNEFRLVYQPIVAANSKTIKGTEALLRWDSASGPVSPAYFIPIAESNGAIIPIGLWIFREVCKTVALIQKECGTDIPYTSFNVSTRQLNEETLVTEFANILKETGAKPENLIIEITETSLMADIHNNIKVLNRLAELGMRVAVDDFGTGYSSLLQLIRMPVSFIKIDREFITELDKKHESRAITSSVIRMAKVMGKKTIAEGVETEAELFELQTQGCDNIQGYYFYKPMPLDNYISLLKNNSVQDINTAQGVYTVIYVSRAAESVDEGEIFKILNTAQKFNAEQGITGFLLFNNGYFMQLLEGRKESVDALLEKIAKDERHKDFKIILRTTNQQRLFQDWSMGYWNMKNTGADIDFSKWQERTFHLTDISKDAKLCYAFFEALSSKNL